ncbi:MAG: tetratricopeptide repeat protein [Chitinivibrionales bacterium]|nr:tetratricopeptide repeat protein [Chitinivibrionales bacterium]
MQTNNRLLAQALQVHKNGDLLAAKKLYTSYLESYPQDAQAHHFAGILFNQFNEFEKAAGHFTQSLMLHPDNVPCLIDSARLHISTNKHDQAYSSLQKALKLAPEHEQVHFTLGNLYRSRNQYEIAAGHYARCTELNPNFVGAYCNLGACYQEFAQSDKAIEAFESALRLKPNFGEVYNNIGLIQLARGQAAPALKSFQKALACIPHSAESHLNAANAFRMLDQHDKAIEHYHKAIAIKPDYAEAFNNLGRAYAEIHTFEKAKESFVNAVRIRSEYAEAHYNLGNLMRENTHMDEAVICFRNALKFKEGFIAALTNLGETFQVMGNLKEAQRCFRQALKYDATNTLACSNLLSCLNYTPGVSPEQLYQEHLCRGRFFPNMGLGKTRRASDPDKKLRLGYVSPDFCRHPVSSFLKPLLSNHTKDEFEIFCYSAVGKEDADTAAYREYADHWRCIRNESDTKLVELIRRDEIDILIDLAGHTAGNRLAVFARKPAPVQLSFLGYPNTTGLTSVDFRITDEIADPDNEPKYHSEELIRLPGCFCCYAPATDAPGVNELPGKASGALTFGSLHNLARLNADVLQLWAQVLTVVAHSRLLIFRDTMNESIEARIREIFTNEGIDMSRIELQRSVRQGKGHLSIYHNIDIALDTFPWSGHTTACEALWMGVPVITMCGERHAGRMVASVLHRLGLTDWIAASAQEYVSIARKQAAAPDALAGLRAHLREGMTSSLLCNGKRYAVEIETAYRSMWRKRCAQ